MALCPAWRTHFLVTGVSVCVCVRQWLCVSIFSLSLFTCFYVKKTTTKGHIQYICAKQAFSCWSYKCQFSFSCKEWSCVVLHKREKSKKGDWVYKECKFDTQGLSSRHFSYQHFFVFSYLICGTVQYNNFLSGDLVMVFLSERVSLPVDCLYIKQWPYIHSHQSTQ